jgi:heme exporter protein B
VIAAALAVARKDLRSEWRAREIVPALAQFALLAILIANFAFDVDAAGPARIAPGVLWLALAFAAVTGFGRAFAAEKDLGTLEAMLLTPAGPTAIFVGKAAAAFTLLVSCELVLVPGLAVFFGVPLSGYLFAAVLLATVGMAALGCLFAALAAQTRARELLLPVLALPLWVPLVIAGGRAVQVAMAGGSPGSDQPLLLLLDFDILFVVTASLAARFVLDD